MYMLLVLFFLPPNMTEEVWADYSEETYSRIECAKALDVYMKKLEPSKYVAKASCVLVR